LKNAYQRFEEEGIIILAKSQGSKAPPKVRLAPDWVPRRDQGTGRIIAEGRLWDFIEMIAQSRREGKNRRDGATVSTRVLRLTEHVGQDLFAATAGGSKLSDEDEAEMRRRKGRRKALHTMAHL
jgi:hypothetical protein